MLIYKETLPAEWATTPSTPSLFASGAASPGLQILPQNCSGRLRGSALDPAHENPRRVEGPLPGVSSAE